MKRCTAYLNGNHCRVHSTHVTVSGIPIIDIPGYDVDMRNDITTASVLRNCITECTGGCPDPKDPNAVEGELLSDYGVKSWREFVKNRKSITIDLIGDLLFFRPKTNQGARGGYAGLPDLIRELPADASPEQVGHAFRECFENSD